MTDSKIQEVLAIFAPLLGEKVWEPKLGHGSFITLEFGKALPSKEVRGRTYTHGEWHLWIYMCVWRLEKGREVLATSEDSHSKIESAIQCLDGLALSSVELTSPNWETIFRFEQEIVIRTFSAYPNDEEDEAYWMLFTPSGNVLSVGSGEKWIYES
ncbi:MAG TPA: hypothetical protein V6C57_01130 [Coleofasciculaceae cyanobacterium]